MRILVAHNSYRDRGGEDRVVANEVRLLRSNDHDVEMFFADNRNIVGLSDSIKAFISAPYAPHIRRQFLKVIDNFKPDIVHVHNFFPLLSPAVHMACSEVGLPVVQTLHNYRFVCPNGVLFRDGAACDDCVGRGYAWPAIVHRCYRRSVVQSWAVANTFWLHRWLRTWEKHVQCFVAVSEKQRDILEEGGLPRERIEVKPNFVPATKVEGSPRLGRYMLFAGRLSIEKGIGRLLDVYRDSKFDVPLVVAGDGPMRERVEREASRRGGLIRYEGYTDQEYLKQLIDEARFVVFPSLWPETFGMGIVEAMARGKPSVIGETASLASSIEHDRAGWILHGKEPSEWGQQLRSVWMNTEEVERRGLRALQAYEQHYEPSKNYARLGEIYSKAMHNVNMPS